MSGMSTQSAAAVRTTYPKRTVPILLLFVLFAAAWVIDGQFLRFQTASAIVTGKEHQDMKQTYVTEKIGNTFRPVPHVIPEQFILKLRMGSKDLDCPVDRGVFRSIQPGQQVQIRYERHRLTRTTTAVSVESK